jgi:hypothetical protein
MPFLRTAQILPSSCESRFSNRRDFLLCSEARRSSVCDGAAHSRCGEEGDPNGCCERMGVGSRPGLPIPGSRFLFATAVFCLALWPAPHASPLGIHGDDWKWTQSAPHRRNADAPADGHGPHHAFGGLMSRLRDWEARGPTEGGFGGGHSTWDGGDDDTSSGQQPGSGRLSSQRSVAFNPPAMLLGTRVPRGSLIGRRPGGQMPAFVPGFGASQKSKAALRMLELRGDQKAGTGIRWKMPSFGTSSAIAMGAVRGQRAESGDVERRENGHDGGDGAKSRTRSSVRSRSPRPQRSDRRGGGGGGGGTKGGMRSGSSLSALRGDEDVEELMAWADRCLGIDTHDRGARSGGGRAGGKEGIARNAVAACYAMNRLKHTPEGNYGIASLSKVVAMGLEAQIDVGHSSRMTGMQISLALNAAAGRRSFPLILHISSSSLNLSLTAIFVPLLPLNFHPYPSNLFSPPLFSSHFPISTCTSWRRPSPSFPLPPPPISLLMYPHVPEILPAISQNP